MDKSKEKHRPTPVLLLMEIVVVFVFVLFCFVLFCFTALRKTNKDELIKGFISVWSPWIPSCYNIFMTASMKMIFIYSIQTSGGRKMIIIKVISASFSKLVVQNLITSFCN